MLQHDKLLASNQSKFKEAIFNCPDMLKMKQAFKKRMGFEMDDEKRFPCMQEGFSFKKAGEKFVEADDKSGFQQLLRAGIQNQVNLSMYQTTGTVYKEITKVIPSKKDTELYAPLTALGFPKEIADGGKYPEVGRFGLDISLKNKKFGSLSAVTYTLEEDDQTGQVQQSAQLMGQYFEILIEVYVMGKIASIAAGCTYAELKVHASETKPGHESTWPWSTTLYGGGANRPGTFSVPDAKGIQNAFIGLRAQKNQLGLRMAVNPDTLLHSPKYEFDIAVVANSAFYPMNVIATTAGSTIGGPGAINPLQGKFKPVMSYYLFDNAGATTGDSKAWYLLDSKVPGSFVTQLRSAPMVVNEAPNSGAGFENDVFRFKGNVRFNADFIEPRFWWQGNDGSSSSATA